MLVLGIDPGTAICGYGLVDMTGNRLRPVFYGSVQMCIRDRSNTDNRNAVSQCPVQQLAEGAVEAVVIRFLLDNGRTYPFIA